MNDEIQSLCDDLEAKLDWFGREADRMKKQSWPNDEPCICTDDDGWTYARVLRSFQEPDVQIFRLARRDCWLVFHDRNTFARFARFINHHPWML